MKNTLLLLFLFTIHYGFSQFNVTGIVYDNLTNTPIENVKVLDTTSGSKVVTDKNGFFTTVASGTIVVSKEGYFTKEIEISKSIDLTIVLDKKVTKLEEVVINDIAIPIKHKESTEAVSVLSSHEINRGNLLELHPILNRVPGVFMQNGTLNTNRISIRGIGARNLFGTANIRAYFGDIPITDGNGESSIEDLELGALSSIEIHKGPSSSSYGVGLGGTILLKPENIHEQKTAGTFSSSFGSYGLRRVLAKASLKKEKNHVTLLYGNTHSDGYRDNNKYDRNIITLMSVINSDEKNSFAVLGSYVNLKAGIPSSLSQVAFENTPRQAAFTWGRSQAFEDVDYVILGITWKHKYHPKLEQHTSVFGSLRNNHEPRPFNIQKEKSNTLGIRSRVLGNHLLAKKQLNWAIGGELFYETYNQRTFENLYEDFPVGTGSIRGARLSDLDEKRYYYNLFTEANYTITKKLKLNIGIHLNQTFFDIEDSFLSDGENNSGSFDFDPILSPKLGINYMLNPHFFLFGNIAHGFSTPTTAETLLPDGLFNPDIKPEIGWNYEIGSRFWFLERLHGSLSIYTLRIEDLLVSRRTVEDNFFAINAGKTIHNGIEAEINYSLIRKMSHQLNFFINTSINDYNFDEFIDIDNNFSGNDLTGVPSEVINLGLDLTSTKGFYGNLNFQTVGKIPANDANTIYSNRYELLHGKIGYKSSIGNHWNYNVSLGVNNILDTKYASQLQINARGFGDNAPRYFYPGLPFNMYGGININYRL
ncbi:TonB-dependent receptor [Aquimarina gracilis]|uniref:TonB-dependent receptor n=1 Tax=Aquimarina gracilis TaxID=874422 RepID=A0ABU5ZYV4_9FLAO|nr:TonB-dependent receptor [Aquimarina gracilis]MEB3347082.1 TonB-dependent receptor [Aquimarina gracilis]